MDEDHAHRLELSVMRWRGYGMNRKECLKALLHNDPPAGRDLTQEEAEQIVSKFDWSTS